MHSKVVLLLYIITLILHNISIKVKQSPSSGTCWLYVCENFEPLVCSTLDGVRHCSVDMAELKLNVVIKLEKTHTHTTPQLKVFMLVRKAGTAVFATTFSCCYMLITSLL